MDFKSENGCMYYKGKDGTYSIFADFEITVVEILEYHNLTSVSEDQGAKFVNGKIKDFSYGNRAKFAREYVVEVYQHSIIDRQRVAVKGFTPKSISDIGIASEYLYKDTFFSKLKIKLNQDSQRIIPTAVYRMPQGWHTIGEKAFCLYGDKILPSFEYPVIEPLDDFKLNTSEVCPTERVCKLFTDFCNILPGVTEVVLVHSLYTTFKSFICFKGIQGVDYPGLILIAKFGHLKSSIAKLMTSLRDIELQKLRLYVQNSEQDTLERARKLNGFTYILDDFHRLSRSEQRASQKTLVNALARDVNEKGVMPGIIITAEKGTELGIESCLDRLFFILFPELSKDELNQAVERIKRVSATDFTSLVLFFIMRIAEKGDEAIEIFKSSYSEAEDFFKELVYGDIITGRQINQARHIYASACVIDALLLNGTNEMPRRIKQALISQLEQRREYLILQKHGGEDNPVMVLYLLLKKELVECVNADVFIGGGKEWNDLCIAVEYQKGLAIKFRFRKETFIKGFLTLTGKPFKGINNAMKALADIGVDKEPWLNNKTFYYCDVAAFIQTVASMGITVDESLFYTKADKDSKKHEATVMYKGE